jgi:ADP-ribosyl-[dinitrogen reductase] hydrolase
MLTSTTLNSPMPSGITMNKLHGSCLCKTIQYEVISLDMPISHCHCQTCRKAHAAQFAANAGVMREHFRWIKGQDRLSSYDGGAFGPAPRYCSRSDSG